MHFNYQPLVTRLSHSSCHPRKRLQQWGLQDPPLPKMTQTTSQRKLVMQEKALNFLSLHLQYINICIHSKLFLPLSGEAVSFSLLNSKSISYTLFSHSVQPSQKPHPFIISSGLCFPIFILVPLSSREINIFYHKTVK